MMMRLRALIARNCKLFFRDKATFFTSLIAPLILLFLYVAFLGTTYSDVLTSLTQGFGVTIEKKIVGAFSGGWLLSSLVAVSAVCIAFNANMVMVQDKTTGKRDDFAVSPVPKSLLALGYYLSTLLVTLAICGAALAVGFIYLSVVGWCLSFTDVLLVILDTALLATFGTAFASLCCSVLSSQGGIMALQVIVSASYGFLCGAYMPIGSLQEWMASVLKFLPGTYGTMLLHEHFMGTAIKKMPDVAGLKDAVRATFDCKLDFFGRDVKQWVCYLVIVCAILLFAGGYVLILSIKGRKPKKPL